MSISSTYVCNTSFIDWRDRWCPVFLPGTLAKQNGSLYGAPRSNLCVSLVMSVNCFTRVILHLVDGHVSIYVSVQVATHLITNRVIVHPDSVWLQPFKNWTWSVSSLCNSWTKCVFYIWNVWHWIVHYTHDTGSTISDGIFFTDRGPPAILASRILLSSSFEILERPAPGFSVPFSVFWNI
jgi:hypothetical protein